VPADQLTPEVVRGDPMEGPAPDVSVVISTYRRPGFLSDLVACLEGQRMSTERFEVLIIDNGSADDTWSSLTQMVAETELRLTVIKLTENRGPAAARNVGISLARGTVVAFTDDDCLPTSGWLNGLWSVFEGGADTVQGLTRPDPTGRRTSTWDRSVEILAPSGLFETCNIAYRTEHLRQIGGFDASTAVIGHRAAHPFGEDAHLGWRVDALGARYCFAGDAVVHHRWLPGSFGSWIAERRQLANFAALARRSSGVSGLLWRRVFLTPTTAAFDFALVSVGLGLAVRRPWVLLGVLPWIVRRWPDARSRTGRNPFIRLAQLGVGDLVGFGALVEGSVRHGRLIL
jgi:glycosyltransferase involved in cell wall biosynthesis